MVRRLLLVIGVGVPFGALAVILVVSGAFSGARIAIYEPCRLEDPIVPLIGRVCGISSGSAIPFASAAVALILLAMYAGLVLRWIRGVPPRVGWSGIWLVGRLLAGCFVGLSALIGGTLFYVKLNNQYWHIGCYPDGRGGWVCEGNIYYGINPFVALFTLALLVLYPVLWNTAEQGVDHDRVRGP